MHNFFIRIINFLLYKKELKTPKVNIAVKKV
jgi:hypothetical protein